MTAASDMPLRRFDLDWLRIIAFGLLILYHMGMFFVTWDWHVKSAHAGPAIQPLMVLTNPWRLTLLFLIAGIVTRFMADRTTASAMAGQRSRRLLLPLVFGVLVIVPPQTYYEIVEKLSWTGGWVEFYAHYITLHDGWRPGGELLIVPTWNHLWFVLYLWVYTMAVVLLRPLLASRCAADAAGAVLRRVSATGVVLMPGLLLIVARLELRPYFPETHALVDDWYLHAVYFPVFLFGYAIARADAVWRAIDALRWPALAVAACCYVVLAATLPMAPELSPAGRMLRDAVWAADQWAWIVMLLGFAGRLLDRDGPVLGPVRRYLTDAVFPFYIIHQTVIVVVGHHLRPLGLPALGEAAVILVATLAACVGGYEVVRRIGWLRPLFGLRPLERAAVRLPARLSA